MRKDRLTKVLAMGLVLSMMLAGCGSVGLNKGTENANGTQSETESKPQPVQSLAASYQNVGGILGEQRICNFHPIPDICQWDAAQNAYVAPDNGTNENGESIVIQITCKDIDKSETYADNFARIEGMLNENKDVYTASGFSYLEDTGYEVIAYYYATEEMENRDGRDYVHTVGVFELLCYTRNGCIDPYTVTTFNVDVVKPADVDNASVYKYFEELFDSVEMGYTETK